MSGVVGEASFSNLGPEPVALWGCDEPFEVEQWVDGGWVRAPSSFDARFAPVGCEKPVWLEAHQRIALPFDTALASGRLPATVRLAYRVGEGCVERAGGRVACDRFLRAASEAFRIVAGDLDIALLERARTRGNVEVVFFLESGSFIPGGLPGRFRNADESERALLDELGEFAVRRLASPSGGGVLALSVDAEALRVLMDHPVVEDLAQLFPARRLVPVSSGEAGATGRLVALFR